VADALFQIIAQVWMELTTPRHTQLSGLDSTEDVRMPRKKKIKRFQAVTAVKEMARERIGTPPPTQVVPDRKKRKSEKHKPTLGKLLNPE
jgi:hypothetical protein